MRAIDYATHDLSDVNKHGAMYEVVRWGNLWKKVYLSHDGKQWIVRAVPKDLVFADWETAKACVLEMLKEGKDGFKS
jgi:hypothetical protein